MQDVLSECQTTVTWSKNPNKEITEYKINDSCQMIKIGVSRKEFEVWPIQTWKNSWSANTNRKRVSENVR